MKRKPQQQRDVLVNGVLIGKRWLWIGLAVFPYFAAVIGKPSAQLQAVTREVSKDNVRMSVVCLRSTDDVNTVCSLIPFESDSQGHALVRCSANTTMHWIGHIDTETP